MARNIVIGIDVGTTATRVAVCEFVRGENYPRVLGIGMSPSLSLRHGYITNVEDAVKSIKKAVISAEESSGIKIKKAFVSIGGISLESISGSGTAVISKADGEITTLDVSKAITESEESIKIPNKKIIHVIPVSYKIDGKDVPGRPEGMRGIKIEVKTLFITCLEQHLDDLVTAITLAGIEVIDVIASPLAESQVALSERQKAAGSALVNIGSETLSVSVFENNVVQALKIFSIGSTDITNDIALGLKISLEEAEGLKIGSLIKEYPKKKLDQIIEARLSDIFELVENYLKKIKRNGLLPAGVILSGGGSNITGIEEHAKNLLKLPAKIASSENLGPKNKLRDPAWLVSIGLCHAEKRGGHNFGENSSLTKPLQEILNFFRSIGGQLMP